MYMYMHLTYIILKMENASKALIMAGAVLIAITLVSIGVLVFTRFSGSVKNNTNLSQQEIQSFNNKLTPYLGENISGSQVNALIQTAVSINYKEIQRNGDTGNFIKITGNGNTYVLVTGSTVTSNKVTTGVYYSVVGNYNQTTGLIDSITVTQNT